MTDISCIGISESETDWESEIQKIREFYMRKMQEGTPEYAAAKAVEE